MASAISAAEANRQFSTVLRHVRSGRTYVITSHGRPVARVVPIRAGEQLTTAARSSLLRRLRAARVQSIGSWTRDELYEDRR